MPSLTVMFEGRTLREHRLDASETVVGSDPQCALFIDYPAVSWRHCAIIASGGATRVRDLGSRNKTFVNGLPVSGERELRHGDMVIVGKHALVFKDENAPPSASGSGGMGATFYVGQSADEMARKIASDHGALDPSASGAAAAVQAKISALEQRAAAQDEKIQALSEALASQQNAALVRFPIALLLALPGLLAFALAVYSLATRGAIP